MKVKRTRPQLGRDHIIHFIGWPVLNTSPGLLLVGEFREGCRAQQFQEPRRILRAGDECKHTVWAGAEQIKVQTGAIWVQGQGFDEK